VWVFVCVFVYRVREWLVLAWCCVVVLNRIVFVTVVCTVVAIFGSPFSFLLRMYPSWFYSTVNWMD